MSQSAVQIEVAERSVARAATGLDRGGDRLSLAKLVVPLAAMGTLLLVIRLYQVRFGFSTGLEAASPEFARHWYPWLAFDLVGLFGSLVVWCVWLARTRCKECLRQFTVSGTIDSRHERYHLWSFTCILLTNFIWLLAMTVHNELDAAWHQSALRDTSLTPTHIFIFYLQVPVAMGLAIGAAVYGRTRLPAVWGPRKGIAAANLVAAGAILYLMMIGAFNEFGHSIWIFEERFANPMHWPIAVGTIGLLGLVPLLIQALDRAAELAEKAQPEGSPEQPAFTSARGAPELVDAQG